VEKAGEIRAYFAKKFLTKTRDEWFNILSQTDIAVGKVYGLDELPSDPQMLHRRMIVEINHPVEGKIKQAGISIKLSETPGTVRRVGGTPGEHTEEVLTSLGYTHDDIGRLRDRGVIG
jgi:crotonobetainyl-CoA:carnitine CoA-transferase CaiB-like acyl-CoA transferase